MDDVRSPCRLFVYLAREAPVGVVLRRGPSDWVRLSLWHTDEDRFEHGQWMRARVFERRSDLSSDGSLFVAFVRGSAGPNRGNTDTWVALSRPPFFTALALWFVGGTYYTGGYFPERKRLWLGWDSPQPDQGRLPHVAGNDQRATAVHRRHERLDRSHCLDQPAAARRLDPARGSRSGNVGARNPGW